MLTKKSLHRPSPLMTLCVIISLLTLYRGWVLFHLPDLSLHFDEAQYWLWAQELQWGYYSKPPMLAATIKLFTGWFGDTEVAIRSIGLIMYPLSTLILYQLTLRITQKSTVAFWASIIFITMPGISLSSLLITTDVILFFWWGLSCYAFYAAIKTNRLTDWLLLGFFAGCGLLTKYTMGIFAIAVGLFLLSSPARWHHFKNPRLWLAALLSACIFAPNLWWNYQNDWPSIRHTAELSSEGVSGLHPLDVLTFWGEQLGVFGLISFPLFFYWVACRMKSLRQMTETQAFLLCFSATFLLIISIQALQGRAYANWAAPTYFIASVIVATQIIHRQALKIALVSTNLLLMLLVYHADTLQDQFRPHATAGADPFKTLRAWDDWAKQIETAIDQCPQCPIIVNSREDAAQLAYQLRDRQPTLLFWNPDQSQNSHYEMAYNLPPTARKGQFLFLTEDALSDAVKQRFAHVTQLSQFSRQGKYKIIRDYTLYRVQDFKGYMP